MAEHIFFGNPEDLPEPLRQFLRAVDEQNDRQEMAVASDEHATNNFLLSLSLDDLGVLRRMFRAVAHGNEPNAVYFCGMIDTLLLVKHNVCPLHLVNHDEELADNLAAHANGGEGSTT